LGIGDWAQSPIPNPQSPIPNPHKYKYLKILEKKYLLFLFFAKKNIIYFINFANFDFIILEFQNVQSLLLT
jgi:hypothetical protein